MVSSGVVAVIHVAGVRCGPCGEIIIELKNARWNVEKVQNSTLRAHETGRNFPLKYRGVWLSPVFGVRYTPLQCPAIVCQHIWGPLALVALFRSHNVLVKYFTLFVTDFAEVFSEKSECDHRKWIFILILHPIALCEVNSSWTTSW